MNDGHTPPNGQGILPNDPSELPGSENDLGGLPRSKNFGEDPTDPNPGNIDSEVSNDLNPPDLNASLFGQDPTSQNPGYQNSNYQNPGFPNPNFSSSAQPNFNPRARGRNALNGGFSRNPNQSPDNQSLNSRSLNSQPPNQLPNNQPPNIVDLPNGIPMPGDFPNGTPVPNDAPFPNGTPTPNPITGAQTPNHIPDDVPDLDTDAFSNAPNADPDADTIAVEGDRLNSAGQEAVDQIINDFGKGKIGPNELYDAVWGDDGRKNTGLVVKTVGNSFGRDLFGNGDSH